MEHLGIDTSLHRHLRIPLYQDDLIGIYNYEGFDKYLATKSMSIEAMLEEFEQSYHLAKQTSLLCLLQNYCFFALAHTTFDLLNVSVSTQELVVQDEEGRRWISTSCIQQKAHQAALHRATNIVQMHNSDAEFLTERQLQVAPICLLALIGRHQPLSAFDKQRLDQLHAMFQLQSIILQKLVDQLNNRHSLRLFFTDPEYCLIFSCIILVDTLRALVNEIHPDQVRRDTVRNWTHTPAFDTFVRLQGWCPNRVAGYPGEPCIAALMMSMPSSQSQSHGADVTELSRQMIQDQSQSQPIREEISRKLYHELGDDGLPACNDRKCHRLPASDISLTPHHRCQDSSSCRMLDLNQLALAEAYERGTYPLLAFTMSNGELTIAIQAYKDGLEYSALSHVWSHGLGNAEENSLPLCQLQFLQELSNMAVPNSPMWVDSILVPVADEHKAARRLAINRMAQIYRSATKTIILDKNIAQADPDDQKAGLDLLCSEWARRLWTLQEAILPGPEKLLLCVRGRLLPWEEVANSSSSVLQQMVNFVGARAQEMGYEIADPDFHERLTRFERALLYNTQDPNKASTRMHPVLEIWNPLERPILRHIEEMLRLLGSNAAPESDCLIRVYDALHRRSVTMATDEFICISQLLNLDLSSFPALPTSMDAVAERVPLADNIIYLPGARVMKKGYRWCPASFLAQDDVSVLPDARPATLTEHGLRVKKAALISGRSIIFEVGKQYLLSEQGRPLGRFSLPSADIAEIRRGRGTMRRKFMVRKPSFLLIRDVRQPFDSSRRTVRFATVDMIDGQSSTETRRSVFVFNHLLIRMVDGETVPRRWLDAFEEVPVRYEAPSDWLID